MFTVSGTTPQDGYYFELTGTTLNAVASKSGTPTAVASTSWTRYGTAPFTLDTNYHRYEIRYAGSYVLFVIDNVVRHALSHVTTTTRTATLNLPVTVQNTNAGSTATNETLALSGVALIRLGGSVDLDMASRTPNVSASGTGTGIPAVGVGPGFDLKGNPSNLGTASNSAITQAVNGAAEVTVEIGTATTGTFVFEITSDDVTWSGALAFDFPNDVWQDGTSITPTVGARYMVRVGGARQWRIRTNATLGATVQVRWTQGAGTSLLKALHVGNAPSRIGYTIVSKTAQYSTTQTTTALWTPATGKKIVVTSVQIQVGGTTAGTLQIYFAASSGAYSRGTTAAIFDGEFAPSATLKPGVVMMPHTPFMSPAVNYLVYVTTSAAMNPLTITLWGYEV